LKHGFLIVVQGCIGTLGPLNLILDTGTTFSIVDAHIAHVFSLPLTSGQVLNFDHSSAISWATLPELRIGPLHAASPRVMVGTLIQWSEFAEGIDGILGLDLLTQSLRMEINFSSMQVTFQPGPSNGAPKSRQPRPVSQLFAIPLYLNGHPIHVVVDTGARNLFLFEDRLRQHIPHFQAVRLWPGVSGPLQGTLVRLADLKVGDTSLDGSAFLMKSSPSSLPDRIDGFLGASLLPTSVLIFDFEGQRLFFYGERTER